MSLIKIKIINMETFIFIGSLLSLVQMMRTKIQRRNLKTIIVKRRASPHHRVMSLGGACEFREFPDMSHGWTTRGDIRSALYHNDYEHFRIFSILVTFYNHKDFAETQQ